MVESEVRYVGELHTESTHGPSGARLETDAPLDNQGRGERFSPTDLVATGLATCMLTTMGIRAQREGWPMEGARARVEKHMQATPLRRIARLVVEIAMPAGLPMAARAPLEHAAHTCPVRESIHADIDVVLRVEWPA